MADITPVTPVVPATPAASAVAGAAPASTAGGQDFLGQLTAALKTLKGLAGAVTGTPVVADVAAPTDTAAPQPDDVQPGPVEETPAVPDDVMELLASLGLVPVPQPVQPSAEATPVGDSARDTTSTSSYPAVAVPADTAPTTPTTSGPQPPLSEVPREASSPAQPPLAQKPVALDTSALVATAPSQTPLDGSSPSPSTVDNVPAPRPQVAPTSQQQQPQVPAPLHPGLQHASVLAGAQDSAQQGGSQDTGDQSRDHAADKSAAVGPAKSDQPATVQHDVNVPINVAASVAQPQAASNAHPAEVVNQIAQQVDLYRLPGSKGVRIQLHPEDLGGVQVTLKYASGGNLELHISVEHAATGALVQEGIGQLRDALATQGFHPDRLVMSVSAAGASSQMDLSSNNNSNGGAYRSDSGFAAFTQNGQSGQQRDTPGNNASAGFGWSSSRDVSPTSEVAPIATDLSTSRIDYRV
jgi:flagellar hook-length control protein FliK